jgi:hypothetical protein
MAKMSKVCTPENSQPAQWENEARLGVKGIKVSRTDVRFHWERLAAGQAVVNEAWCEKD